MEKIKIQKLEQKVFDLFDKYVHSYIDRWHFLEQVSMYAVGGLSAAAILDYFSPKYVQSQQIKADDPRLRSEFIDYKSPQGAGEMRGLLTRLAENQDKLPGLVVVHENRGLNPFRLCRICLWGYIICK